jgi:hypothetical protein
MLANGSATANYTLPGGTAVGSYTIDAVYSGSAHSLRAAAYTGQWLNAYSQLGAGFGRRAGDHLLVPGLTFGYGMAGEVPPPVQYEQAH